MYVYYWPVLFMVKTGNIHNALALSNHTHTNIAARERGFSWLDYIVYSLSCNNTGEWPLPLVKCCLRLAQLNGSLSIILSVPVLHVHKQPCINLIS